MFTKLVNSEAQNFSPVSLYSELENTLVYLLQKEKYIKPTRQYESPHLLEAGSSALLLLLANHLSLHPLPVLEVRR